MIISIDVEKIFDKDPTPFKVKSICKLRIEENINFIHLQKHYS